MSQRRSILTISKTAVISFFVFLILFEPAYLTQIRLTNRLFQGLTLICYLYVLFCTVRKGNFKFTRTLFLTLILYGILLISTVLYQGTFLNAFAFVCSVFAGILYVYSFERDNLADVLDGIVAFFAVVIFINLLTVILYPNGLYEGTKYMHENYYFLGHNNAVARYLLPGIILSCYRDFYKKNKISLFSFILAIASFVTVVLTWSNAAMVCIALFVVWMLTWKFSNRILAKTPGYVIFFIPVILFLFIVLLNRTAFLEYLVNFFGKDLTFSGRIYVWAAALKAISNRFFLGYGYGATVTNLGYYSLEVAGCHNYFLDLLLTGGVFRLIVQLILNWRVCKTLDRLSDNTKSVFMMGFSVYFILWQFSIFTGVSGSIIYILFILVDKLGFGNSTDIYTND